MCHLLLADATKKRRNKRWRNLPYIKRSVESKCMFACFRAYVGQPHGHLDWATSMPFASINPRLFKSWDYLNSTNARTKPWNFRKKYWELAFLKNVEFLSRPFYFYFYYFFYFFSHKKTSQSLLVSCGTLQYLQPKCDNVKIS